MDNCIGIVETREVLSVVCDQLGNYNENVSNSTLDKIQELANAVLDGEELVLGQLVQVKSYLDGNTYGTMHAIVSRITRVSPSSLVYDLTLLSGNLNGELATVRYKNTQIKEALTVVIDNTDIVDGLKSTLLGQQDSRAMKVMLGIPHIFALKDNGKFTSYM